ncbi:hypothetical protein [Mangrovicella endophytica]|uniref:hypothetical protein n=1 Tax=Mangrovicella endophytica TaxID=2066697 RepID=UPI0013000432|nr:hypothetical protein [Mangrovicella endophytica]
MTSEDDRTGGEGGRPEARLSRPVPQDIRLIHAIDGSARTGRPVHVDRTYQRRG